MSTTAPDSSRARPRPNLAQLFPLLLRVDLRKLILGLSLLAVLMTFVDTFYAGYAQQRELLIRNTLDANEAYASKMADMTDRLLALSLSKLAYSALQLGQDFGNRPLHDAETRRLQQQDQTFNSVLLFNAKGHVISVSPPMRGVIGTKAISNEIVAAIAARKPRISEPFVTSGTNRFVIFISQPIFSPTGQFLGVIGGTVYLNEVNSLNSTLGEHHYQNGVYLFVVDRKGNLLFHQDPQRIGQNVMANLVVQDVLKGQAGSRESINTRGQAMISGYAPVATTGWGVVVQRPTGLTLSVLAGQMASMLLKVAPLLLLTLLVIWYFARKIAHPLHKLAVITSTLDDAGTAEKVGQLSSWYYEVIRLKHAILVGLNLIQRKITRLNHESMTDALTGLLNRRGMDDTLQAWEQSHLPFAVISIDLDHFKGINDTYGHDAGDDVLRFLAAHMRRTARAMDVLCRNGGDEFTMLLPKTSAIEAGHAARRLAQTVAQEDALPGLRITLSMGIADFQPDESAGATASTDNTLKAADMALYQAKQNGRNQIVLSSVPA